MVRCFAKTWLVLIVMAAVAANVSAVRVYGHLNAPEKHPSYERYNRQQKAAVTSSTAVLYLCAHSLHAPQVPSPPPFL